MSAPTVWRILKKSRLKKTKPTRKRGLTPKMKREGLLSVISVDTGHLSGNSRKKLAS